jgi:hypothetical protein
MALAYTKKDVGCWIDGAFGEEHRRAKLADMVRDLETREMIDTRGYSVVESLSSAPTDSDRIPADFSDEDDALEILQEFTESGLVWTFESGDLLLLNETEVE